VEFFLHLPNIIEKIPITHYSGCHKYVPFAGFANKRNVCKNEEKLLERLDQALLEVIDNPQKTQQTTAIGTLF
jgi:hypothetical protein